VLLGEENYVFTSSPIKPFKSVQNTVVSHMTYVATETNLFIFDQDGTLLLDYLLEVPFVSAPIKVVRSTMVSDPVFYVLTSSDVYQFRCRLEEDNTVYKGLKALKIVADWQVSPADLAMSGTIQHAVIAKAKKGSRLQLIDSE